MARSRSPSPFIPPPPGAIPAGGGGVGVIPPMPGERVVPSWSPNGYPHGPNQLHPAGYTPHMRADAHPLYGGQDYFPPAGAGPMGGRLPRAGARDETGEFSEDWVGFSNGPPWAGTAGPGPIIGSGFVPPQNLPAQNRTSPWMRQMQMQGSGFPFQQPGLPPQGGFGAPPPPQAGFGTPATGWGGMPMGGGGGGGWGGGGAGGAGWGAPPAGGGWGGGGGGGWGNMGGGGWGGAGGAGGWGAGPAAGPWNGTPWMGGGWSTTPIEPVAPLPSTDHPAGMQRPQESIQSGLDTRWMVGKNYGPVLTPLIASLTHARPKLNPLLLPPPEANADERAHLIWNMLFSSSYTRCSTEADYLSWSSGRTAPATFPRLTSLRLISRSIPWVIDIRAKNPEVGVLCGELIDQLSDFMQGFTGKTEWDSLSPRDKERIQASYWHNRSPSHDVPGGRLGQGMRRCDWLGQDSMFGGLVGEEERAYIKERMGYREAKRDIVGVFVLRCDRRLAIGEDEAHARDARGSSRPPSRAGSHRSHRSARGD